MDHILRHAQVSVQCLSINEPMIGTAFPVDVTSLLVIQSIDQLAEQAERILSLIRKKSAGGSG